MAEIDDKINILESDYINNGKLKRAVYYELYYRKIKDELDLKSNTKDKLNFLLDNLNSIQGNIMTLIGKTSKQDNSRKLFEFQSDIIREFIEEINSNTVTLSSNEYKYYPELNDPNFNNEIYVKKEFYRNKAPPLKLESDSKISKLGFVRSNQQKFVKNFISPSTPYNGLLLYHEVGVGKTCAAVGIAEGFRDYISQNNKILVLTPSETLVDNWRNEILNIDKELSKINSGDNKNVQCTGTRYINQIPNIQQDILDNKDLEPENRRKKFKKQAKKVINKHYEFMGYQKLANSIKKAIDGRSINRQNIQAITIQYIRDRFSNLVIIMDEVHETRIGDSGKDKLVVPWLEMIARYSVNTKLILLTATPMYNIASEIVWILNLLLLNDKRAPIQEHLIFEKADNDYTFKNDEASKNYFYKKTNGYISFVRGEDPISFPIKLEPQGAVIANSKYEIVKGKKVPIRDSERSLLKIFSSNMSEWHFQEFSKITNTGSSSIEDFNSSFPVSTIQASNIIYPNPDKIDSSNFLETPGGTRLLDFNRCFPTTGRDKKYSIHKNLTNFNETNKSFFHRDNIDIFSTKFKTIIDSITSCKGIVFVYSDYLSSGIKALAMALECNGFDRLTYKKGSVEKENLLSNPDKDTKGFCAVHNKYYEELSEREVGGFKKAQYILLEGQTDKSTLNELVKEARGEGAGSIQNVRGEHIKVILGSQVVKQGISLKNVREVHILEPWFHLNEMEQASGRAIRRESHKALPEDERNVTIYLHISVIPKSHTKESQDVELIDERTYRKAFAKLKNMSNIDRLIKQNAIDCQLNKYVNFYSKPFYSGLAQDPFAKRYVVNSKGNKIEVELYDKDGSEECNFQMCDYNCKAITNENLTPDDIDYTTFTIEFAEDDIILIKEYIKQLFFKNYILNDKEIINEINTLFSSEIKDINDTSKIDSRFVYIALDNLINTRETFYDEQNKPGYLIERDNFYIFQPLQINDENIPIKYRYLPNYKNIRDFELTIIPDPKLIYTTSDKKKSLKLKTKTVESNTSFKEDIFKLLQKIYIAFRTYAASFYNHHTVIGLNVPDMAKYLLQSYFETNYNNDLRRLILEEIIIKWNGGERDDKLTDVEKAILYYYYIPSYYRKFTDKFTFIIDSGHLENVDSINEEQKYSFNIEGYFWIKGVNLVFYEYVADKNKFIVNPQNRAKYRQYEIKLPDKKKIPNSDVYVYKSSGLYGYYKEAGQKRTNKFHIVNKKDSKWNPEMDLSKKTRRKGAVCGTAQAATKKSELVDVIKVIYNNTIDKSLDFNVYNRSKSVPNKTNNEIGKKPNLCEEIEILLRFRDDKDFYERSMFSDEIDSSGKPKRIPMVSRNNRYFYRKDEKALIDINLKSDDSDLEV